MNTHVKAVFDKPMNRRQFLGHVGAFILTVVGISGIIRFFLNGGMQQSSGAANQLGYGSGAYGGKSRAS